MIVKGVPDNSGASFLCPKTDDAEKSFLQKGIDTMTHSIITQDKEIVNYDNVVKIITYTVSSGEEPEADREIGFEPVYLIEAVTNEETIDGDGENTAALGIYEDEMKADDVLEQIIKWLKSNSESVFRMPE